MLTSNSLAKTLTLACEKQTSIGLVLIKGTINDAIFYKNNENKQTLQ